MHPLPWPLLPLTCASLCVGTLAFVFTLICLTNPDISVQNVLWVIPATFFITLLHHIATLIIARRETYIRKYLFTTLASILSFALAALWTSVAGVIVVITIKEGRDGFKESGLAEHHLQPLLVIPCVLCPVEAAAMWWWAFIARRETQAQSYAAKWRPATTPASQTWR